MDVVGIVTPLVRGGAQVLHGDQVVELSVLLEVHEKGEVEEDGEGQIEVEGEDELKEKRSSMTMNVDEMRLKNTLSHEVHVTQTSKERRRLRALSACSSVVHLARVHVRVIVLELMWFVSCSSSVLVLFMLYSYSLRSQFSVVGGILFTMIVCAFLREMVLLLQVGRRLLRLGCCAWAAAMGALHRWWSAVGKLARHTTFSRHLSGVSFLCH